MNWKNEEFKLAHHLAYWSARTIVELACAQGKRLPLAWVEDAFFRGIFDGLTHHKVPKTTIADMLGMSPRTLRRRGNTVSELPQTGLSLWTVIHEHCLKKKSTREELFARFFNISSVHLTTMLNDMVAMHWLTFNGTHYEAVALSDNLSDDELDAWLTIYSTEPLTEERLTTLSEYMKVPVERLQGRLDKLILKGVIINQTRISEQTMLESFCMIHAIMTRLFMRQKNHGTGVGYINISHLSEDAKRELFASLRDHRDRIHTLFARYDQPHPKEEEPQAEHMYWTFAWGRGEKPGRPEH